MQAADLSGILSDYATHLHERRGLGASAASAYLKAARELIEAVQAIPTALLLPPQAGLESVDKRALEIYLRYLESSRGWRRTTLATHLGALRAFFDFLASAGHVPRNPARGLQISVDKRVPPIPDGEEIRVRALLAGGPRGLTGSRVRLLAELIYGAGLRPSRVYSLRDLRVGAKRDAVMACWDGGETELTLSRDGLKRAQAYLEARDRLWRELGGGTNPPFWVGGRGRPLSGAALARQLRDAMKRAGLEGGPAALRKIAARHFRQRGADLRSLQKFLGARRLGGLERYQPPDWRAVASAFRKFHPRAGTDQPSKPS